LRYHKQIDLYVNIYIIYNTFSKLFNRLGGESKAFDRNPRPVTTYCRYRSDTDKPLTNIKIRGWLTIVCLLMAKCRLSTVDCRLLSAININKRAKVLGTHCASDTIKGY